MMHPVKSNVQLKIQFVPPFDPAVERRLDGPSAYSSLGFALRLFHNRVEGRSAPDSDLQCDWPCRVSCTGRLCGAVALPALAVDLEFTATAALTSCPVPSPARPPCRRS